MLTVERKKVGKEGQRTEEVEMANGTRARVCPQALVFEGKKEAALAGKRWDASNFSVKWIVRSSQRRREEWGPKV